MLIVGRVEQFEVAYSETVEPYIMAAFDTRYLGDMRYLFVFRLVEVIEYGSRCNDTAGKVFDAKPFERVYFELFEESVACRFYGIDPVVLFEFGYLGRQCLLEKFSVFSLVEYFFGCKRVEKFLGVFQRALAQIKFACGYVEERYAHLIFVEMYCTQKVVFSHSQHIIIGRYTGGNKLGNTAFHQCFGKLRVFELVADSHPQAGSDKLGQVGIQCVVREPCQLHVSRRPVLPLGERDAQYGGCFDGIFGKGLVEVAHPE